MAALSSSMVKEGRTVYVSLAHRYWNPGWSAQQNLSVYGADASVEGMGANMRLDGYAMNPSASELTALLPALESVKGLIDHRSVFDDLPEFKSRASTLESMAEFLGQKLFASPLGLGKWHSLRLWQGENLSCVTFPGQERLELNLKVMDLWLTFEGKINSETGLIRARGEVFPCVQQAYGSCQNVAIDDRAAWLFKYLQSQLEFLTRVEIDLTRQKYLVLGSDT